MIEFRKLNWMVKKDLLFLWRHKPQLVAIFCFPMIMIFLFGYGMGGTLDDIPIVVASQDTGEISDYALKTIKSNSLYDVKNVVDDVDDAKKMVNDGEVKAAIILPENFEDSANKTTTVVFYVDSSDQMTSQVLVPSTQALFSEMSVNISSGQVSSNNDVEVEDAKLESKSSIGSSVMNMASSISLQIKKIYGEIKYIDFLVPAILGMTTMMSCMMSMGQSVAGERETGELARLFMTPTDVSTVVAGKILARLVIETGRVIVLLLSAMILFDIVVKGSLIITLGLLVLTALCFIGCAIMISARVGTQEDYIQMILPITMPMMFISGVFYPIETMPWFFQKLAYICPLTYANNALRGVMLQGRGLGDIWVEILVLIGFTVVFYIIGILKFDRDV